MYRAWGATWLLSARGISAEIVARSWYLCLWSRWSCHLLWRECHRKVGFEDYANRSAVHRAASPIGSTCIAFACSFRRWLRHPPLRTQAPPQRFPWSISFLLGRAAAIFRFGKLMAFLGYLPVGPSCRISPIQGHHLLHWCFASDCCLSLWSSSLFWICFWLLRGTRALIKRRRNQTKGYHYQLLCYRSSGLVLAGLRDPSGWPIQHRVWTY